MVKVRSTTHTRIDHRARMRTLTLIVVATLALLWTSHGAADNTVTLVITSAGPLSAVVLDGTLYPIEYSDTGQRVGGVLHLLISDRRGSSEGWTVNLTASDFEYLGSSPLGQDIPSKGFRIVTSETPLVVAGQARGDNGPYAMPITGLSLDTARTVIWSAPGGGSGDYEQFLEVELDIPAGSQPGLYMATLTVAYTSAP